MNKMREVCRKFAEQTGVATLEGDEDVSIIRWLVAGALTKEQKQLLSDIYEAL